MFTREQERCKKHLIKFNLNPKKKSMIKKLRTPQKLSSPSERREKKLLLRKVRPSSMINSLSGHTRLWPQQMQALPESLDPHEMLLVMGLIFK